MCLEELSSLWGTYSSERPHFLDPHLWTKNNNESTMLITDRSNTILHFLQCERRSLTAGQERRGEQQQEAHPCLRNPVPRTTLSCVGVLTGATVVCFRGRFGRSGRERTLRWHCTSDAQWFSQLRMVITKSSHQFGLIWQEVSVVSSGCSGCPSFCCCGMCSTGLHCVRNGRHNTAALLWMQ